jgi:hypothetical protein
MDANRKLSMSWMIVTLLLAMYAWSYLALSERGYGRTIACGHNGSTTTSFVSRDFKHAWMINFYRPMIYVESKVRGQRLRTWSDRPSF